MANKNIDEILNWYISKRPLYKNLAIKVESIIKEVLDSSNISYYTISSRAKEIDSFINKAKKDKYDDPINQITDIAGVRVITFVKSEVYQCCEVIKPLFDIDESNSIDKGKELGNDKVGYRSVHYVAKLTEDRLKLPEYKIFNNMCFEIQIRTILEHAWADISHDRNYKFQGVLPPDNDIQRRFSLAAATLELVDREFDSIAKEIGSYESAVEEKTERGELDIDINTTSLRNYLKFKFSKYIKLKRVEPTFRKSHRKVIKELNDYGIFRLSDLDKIIKQNEMEDYFIFGETNNFLGLLRSIMLLDDAERYFKMAWNKNWKGIDEETIEKLREHRINIDELVRRYDLDVMNYAYDYGMEDEQGDEFYFEET